jgi:hypothetical protein
MGNQDQVDEIQRHTGVKDTIANCWFSQLVPKAREMQKARTRDEGTKDGRLRDPKLQKEERERLKLTIKEEIRTDLLSWVSSQCSDSLVGTSGNGIEPTLHDWPGLSHTDSDNMSHCSHCLRPGDHYNILLSSNGK